MNESVAEGHTNNIRGTKLIEIATFGSSTLRKRMRFEAMHYKIMEVKTHEHIKLSLLVHLCSSKIKSC